jgi:hypothetical protein
MGTLRISTPGAPGEGYTGWAQHKVDITLDGQPLERVIRCSVGIDYDKSGVLSAELDVVLPDMDVTVDWNDVGLHTTWNGKRYRLVEEK